MMPIIPISALALAFASLTSRTCGLAIALKPHFEEDIFHHSGATNQMDRKEQTRDLVFMHIPYNFGHTVEEVALLEPKLFPSRMMTFASTFMVAKGATGTASWDTVNRVAKPNAVVWSHANPDLQEISPVTGCPLYFTPQKYWPEEAAQKYFGDKTVFGLLRDPYERLVAMFRGNIEGYGGGWSEAQRTACDLNGALKSMMTNMLQKNSSSNFEQECGFLPQAEYFDGKYGIKLPVNNRRFPDSMNEIFLEHGYSDDFVIRAQDVFHVEGCNDMWAADLDEDVKGMVRQYFARDFDLLCEHFGYCDSQENTCIAHVQDMCPAYVLKAGLVSMEPTRPHA